VPDWLVAHLNELTESDLQLLAQTTAKFHVVHSPRSHRYFGHRSFPFKRLTRLGFNVSLGTDSLASSESLNLFEEMRAFQRNEPETSPRNILEMVTVNPALALNQRDSIGRISAALRADLIAIPCQGGRNLFEEIVAFDRQINWMMIDGKDVNHLAIAEERSPA
jgi:cytosine/adenosine deaminase-related metal-dependent hydrolase